MDTVAGQATVNGHSLGRPSFHVYSCCNKRILKPQEGIVLTTVHRQVLCTSMIQTDYDSHWYQKFNRLARVSTL